MKYFVALAFPVFLALSWFIAWCVLYWTPFFPRAVRGRAVTLVTTRFHSSDLVGSTQKARMRYIDRRCFSVFSNVNDEPMRDSEYRYVDEGITWCFGHDGKAVDALHVVQALKAS